MRLIIGASRNHLIGSRALQWWMDQEYSHVYARWELRTQQRDIVYQASHGMVHYRSLENFSRDNIIVKEFTLDLTDEQFKKFSRKCIDLAGEKYSTLQLLQIFISDISGGKLIFKDQSGYICSELMCELLEDIGIKFTKPKYLVRPDDIIKQLEIYNSESR
jgi:hypothetical protein